MRRNKSNKKNISFSIFKYLSILIGILLVSFMPLLLQRLITVDQIMCQSQFGECPSDFTNYFSLLEGQNYYDIKKQIFNYLSRPEVEEYLVSYQMFNQINVDMVVKKPKFAIKNVNIFYLVTSDGYIVAAKTETDLPFLELDKVNEYKFGDIIENDLLNVLNLVSRTSWLYNIDSAKFSGNDVTLVTNEGVILRLPLSFDIDHVMGSLNIIFSRLNDSLEGIRMSDISQIDLRFVNPVLKKK